MPPKCLVHVQSLRDTFTENESSAVVVKWATETIDEMKKIAEKVKLDLRELRAGNYTHGQAKRSSLSAMTILQEFQELCHSIYNDAEIVRTVVLVRIPEIKEEDNLGVAVQHAVLKLVDELEAKLLGSEKSGGEKGGGPALLGMFAIRQFAAARCEVEEKIYGKEGKEDENAAKLRLLEHQEICAEFMIKVEVAAAHLANVLRGLVAAYGLNRKKLIQPRSAMDHMVS